MTEQSIPSFIRTDALPRHVAVIMDGNGRWAKKRGLSRTAGHKKGVESTQLLVKTCAEMGIEYLTIYAFSSENWKRPEQEIEDLMDLLRFYLRREISTLSKNNVRMRIIGDRDNLAPDIQKEIIRCEEITQNNDGMELAIALSYGSRQEMTYALQSIIHDVTAKNQDPKNIDTQTITSTLFTHGMPDPDLLIRTGGELRLSNFLLWQCAYTELYFSDVLWPDFTQDDLYEAIADYQKRERRYGTA